MRGLRPDDVAQYIDCLIENREYWKRLDSDLYHAKGNGKAGYVQQMINAYIVNHKGMDYIKADDARELVQGLLNEVCAERFNSDAKWMNDNDAWKGVTQIGANGGIEISKDTKAIRLVLNDFITLGTQSRIRIDKQRVSVYPVEALTLTGFTFNQ